MHVAKALRSDETQVAVHHCRQELLTIGRAITVQRDGIETFYVYAASRWRGRLRAKFMHVHAKEDYLGFIKLLESQNAFAPVHVALRKAPAC
jgi:hypothetical protein